MKRIALRFALLLSLSSGGVAYAACPLEYDHIATSFRGYACMTCPGKNWQFDPSYWESWGYMMGRVQAAGLQRGSKVGECLATMESILAFEASRRDLEAAFQVGRDIGLAGIERRDLYINPDMDPRSVVDLIEAKIDRSRASETAKSEANGSTVDSVRPATAWTDEQLRAFIEGDWRVTEPARGDPDHWLTYRFGSDGTFALVREDTVWVTGTWWVDASESSIVVRYPKQDVTAVLTIVSMESDKVMVEHKVDKKTVRLQMTR